MAHPRTAAIADLAEQLEALDPPAVRIARVRARVARDDLASLVRRGAPGAIVQAYRYRADRAADLLADAWRDAASRH